MDKIDETQIRPCLVLFAEIVGLDRYASRMEPEEYAELLRGVFEQLDEAVLLYNGHLDKHKENVLMATFGAPRAHEDDPERALRARQV